MSAAATSRVPVRHAAAPAATTPQLLKQGMYASVGCSLLMLAAVLSGTRNHREAIQIIGRDTAPSIVAAQHVAAAMADMDASAVNELLFSKDDLSKAAQQAYDNRRKEASEVLIAAAENIKYDAERAPIRTLSLGLGSYAEQIQRARDSRSIDAYRAAAAIMDQTLLPAARELDQAKRSVFDRAYDDQQKWSSGAMLFLVLSSGAVVAVLIALQVFLNRRTRRVFNPLLMVATGLAFLSFFFFAESFTRADRELKIAKADAFESVHALWKARAVAYSANADESRYLLDTAHAPQYEQAFLQKSDQGVNRFLADELKNITFEGEREAAEKAVSIYGDYRKIDTQIRSLEHSGQHAAAIRLCTGESNAVFDKFDKAIDETLQINQSAFDQAVKSGFDAVNNLEILACASCGLVALLSLLGLLPRLREYTAA